MLSRVDYCNPLYNGLPNFLLAKLQRIMNSAARLIFRLSPSTPTPPYLNQLRWLPIRQLSVQNPIVCASLCRSAWQSPTMFMGTNETKQDGYKSQYFYNLFVLKFRSNFGRRSFSHAIAVEWKELSFDLKLIPSEILFRRKLKIVLFYFS